MKSIKIHILVRILLAVAPLVLVAAVYTRLPDQIPMQWDFGGEVNYEPKWHLWVVAGLGPLFGVSMPLVARVDPRHRNYAKFSSPYRTFQIIMLLFVLAMVSLVIIESLRPGTMHVGRFVCLLLGLMFTILGNVMPKFRPNYFYGFKTPWTLDDPTVWVRTHRLGGRLFFAAGLISIAASFLPDAHWMFAACLIPLVLAAVIPSVMSYLWYRRLHSSQL